MHINGQLTKSVGGFCTVGSYEINFAGGDAAMKKQREERAKGRQGASGARRKRRSVCDRTPQQALSRQGPACEGDATTGWRRSRDLGGGGYGLRAAKVQEALAEGGPLPDRRWHSDRGADP